MVQRHLLFPSPPPHPKPSQNKKEQLMNRLTSQNNKIRIRHISGSRNARLNPPSCRETCSFCPLQKAPLPFLPVYILSSTQLYTTPNSICGRKTSLLYQTWVCVFVTAILFLRKPGMLTSSAVQWQNCEILKMLMWRRTRGGRGSSELNR